MECEACDREPIGVQVFDYCARCRKRLCPECMSKGCCGEVPAESGRIADMEEE